jgi:hypothetical protein
MDKRIAALDHLKRYEPTASFSMTMESGSSAPCTRIVAGMRETGNSCYKGYGSWVKFDDVLHMLVLASGVSE